MENFRKFSGKFPFEVKLGNSGNIKNLEFMEMNGNELGIEGKNQTIISKHIYIYIYCIYRLQRACSDSFPIKAAKRLKWAPSSYTSFNESKSGDE